MNAMASTATNTDGSTSTDGTAGTSMMDQVTAFLQTQLGMGIAAGLLLAIAIVWVI